MIIGFGFETVFLRHHRQDAISLPVFYPYAITTKTIKQIRLIIDVGNNHFGVPLLKHDLLPLRKST